jgi:hypothetical protein
MRWSGSRTGVSAGDAPATLEAFLERVHPEDRAEVRAAIGGTAPDAATRRRDLRVVWPALVRRTPAPAEDLGAALRASAPDGAAAVARAVVRLAEAGGADAPRDDLAVLVAALDAVGSRDVREDEPATPAG